MNNTSNLIFFIPVGLGVALCTTLLIKDANQHKGCGYNNSHNIGYTMPKIKIPNNTLTVYIPTTKKNLYDF